MAMMECPECNNPVSSKAESCPHCGFSVASWVRERESLGAGQERPEGAGAKGGADAKNTIGGLIIFAMLVGCCVWPTCSESRDRAEAERVAEEKRAAEEEEAREERAALRGSFASEGREELEGALGESRSALDGGDIEGALGALERLERGLARFRQLEPGPPELRELRSASRVVRARIDLARVGELMEEEDWESALSTFAEAERLGVEFPEQAPDHARARLEVARLHRKSADALAAPGTFVKAESAYTKVLAELEATPEGLRTRAHARELSAVKKKLSRAKKKADKEREKAAERAAYRALCGDPPTPDAWDAGIHAVQSFVESSAHDPGSIDVEGCSAPVLTEKECWRTTCDVLGKNAFGAQVRNRGTFWISGGGVHKSKM